ncbi:MAG: PEGA domain-containing protein, partial [Solirubrobacteraceae bacterium]
MAGAVPMATLVRFRRVREMVDEGWRAYLRVQIDFAHNRLAAARAEAEPLVVFPGGAELYADAALRLGAVLLYRRVPEAQAVLALALALDPDRPITVAEFSPDVVEAVDAGRAAPAAFQRVHITSAPAGAIVAIDGKELGRSPLDAQVTRGPHLVVARAPLHHAAVEAVVIGEPATVELTLDNDDAAARLAAGAEPGLPPAAEQQLIDAALRFADLDEVVVAAIIDRRGGPTLILQRCTGAPAAGPSGEARCTPVIEVGFGDRAGLAAAVREAWQAAQRATPHDAPTVVAESKQRPAPTGCKLCRNPLLWTGIGAVVVGTAIAIVIATQS